MSEKIILNSGLKTIEIEFEDRNVTTEIKFNPADPDLALRFSKFQERVDKKISELEEIELNTDGTPKDLSYVKQIEDINDIIYSELDYAFGNKISAQLFQFCNPMASVGGKYFVVSFIEAITPVIQKCAIAEKNALQKHFAKYNR